jgi:hypothetical protein
VYPWHVFHYFAPIKKLIELEIRPEKFKGNFGYLKALLEAVSGPSLSNLNMKDPYREMIQVLKLRHERVRKYSCVCSAILLRGFTY